MYLHLHTTKKMTSFTFFPYFHIDDWAKWINLMFSPITDLRYRSQESIWGWQGFWRQEDVLSEQGKVAAVLSHVERMEPFPKNRPVLLWAEGPVEGHQGPSRQNRTRSLVHVWASCSPLWWEAPGVPVFNQYSRSGVWVRTLSSVALMSLQWGSVSCCESGHQLSAAEYY